MGTLTRNGLTPADFKVFYAQFLLLSNYSKSLFGAVLLSAKSTSAFKQQICVVSK